jgi:hypothetical protein
MANGRLCTASGDNSESYSRSQVIKTVRICKPQVFPFLLKVENLHIDSSVN